ncbi:MULTISPECIES: uroporphyrinogen-III synthase [Micrococcaceae]|uniref:uroporphyrinogen-III synthase n=1 Tax=unclassified Kocuria TaxID=2649579 RepID=UPI0013EC857F|nr:MULTISPECIES: uroporphyrinogen-III synthase [unclassified Kocuria]
MEASPTGATASPRPRVLVTRGPERSSELIVQLRRRGLEPVLSPLSEAELVGGKEAQHVVDALHQESYDVVTFTSANGVWAVRALLEAHGLRTVSSILASARIWCVGEATRRAAQDAGLAPVEPPEENSAMGMLAAWTDVMGSEEGQKVLCVHGRPARAELANGLRERGLRVSEAVVYERVPYPADRPLVAPRPDSAMSATVLDRQATMKQLRDEADSALSAIVATSPRLIQTLDDLGPVKVPVICIGRTTERAAQDLHLETFRSESPGAEDLAEAVIRALGRDTNSPRKLKN